jgi:hypothetical protein
MNGTGYKLLGLVVWRGAKWCARRRLPSSRNKLALAAVGGLSVAGAAGVIVRRAAS